MVLWSLGRIRKAEVYPVSVPFNRPFRLASGPYLPRAEYVLFCVGSGSFEGWGESSPMPSFSGIGQAEVVKELKAAANLLENEEINLIKLLKKIDEEIRASPYALCAIENALLDLIGRMLDIPIHQLLGGRVRDHLELIWPIGLGEMDFIIEEARKAAKSGFRGLKLKVGENLEEDVKRVRMLREEFPNLSLRVDANQGYSREDAVRAGKIFSELGVELFEQPVEKSDIEGLKLVRETGVKVMADESCYNPSDAYRLLAAEAVDVINIKIMKSSGLVKAKEIAAVCEAAGAPNSLGSMLELGVGTAAGLQFAASCPNIKYRAEIVGPLFLEDDLIEKPLEYRSGAIYLPRGSGLGVSVDLAALEEYGVKF